MINKNKKINIIFLFCYIYINVINLFSLLELLCQTSKSPSASIFRQTVSVSGWKLYCDISLDTFLPAQSRSIPTLFLVILFLPAFLFFLQMPSCLSFSHCVYTRFCFHLIRVISNCVRIFFPYVQTVFHTQTKALDSTFIFCVSVAHAILALTVYSAAVPLFSVQPDDLNVRPEKSRWARQ